MSHLNKNIRTPRESDKDFLEMLIGLEVVETDTTIEDITDNFRSQLYKSLIIPFGLYTGILKTTNEKDITDENIREIKDTVLRRVQKKKATSSSCQTPRPTPGPNFSSQDS